MKCLVLDTKSGALSADLFILDEGGSLLHQLGLGYVPVLYYDRTARELIVHDTEIHEDSSVATQYWLKSFSVDSFEQRLHIETPERPMYAGFPSRSTGLSVSPSGRYLYFLANRAVIRYPDDEDVFRLSAQRYDRRQAVLEPGAFAVESCTVDFGQIGEGEDSLYFHLSCDFPSTLAFGSFRSPDIQYLQLEATPPRTHAPQETCGSWLDKASGSLFCVTGEGKLYLLRPPAHPLVPLARLPLSSPRCVPLHQLYGSDEHLFVGIAVTEEERSLGMASEIWQVSRQDGSLIRVIELPCPVISFAVSSNGRLVAGTNPYEQSLIQLDVMTGQTISAVEHLGISPAEVLLIP